MYTFICQSYLNKFGKNVYQTILNYFLKQPHLSLRALVMTQKEMTTTLIPSEKLNS